MCARHRVVQVTPLSDTSAAAKLHARYTGSKRARREERAPVLMLMLLLRSARACISHEYVSVRVNSTCECTLHLFCMQSAAAVSVGEEREDTDSENDTKCKN